MQNSFFQAICRVGIFMICAQALVHFRPKEAYEKYLKLLVSVMVLIQIFLPVGNFLLGKGGQGAAQALEQFGHELEQGMRDAEESAAAADALLEKMTLEEVRRLLEGQKEESLGEEKLQDSEKESADRENLQEESPQSGSESRESEPGVGKIEIETDAIEAITVEAGR